MNQEYIIINKAAIQKRIEDMQKYVTYLVNQDDFDPTTSLIALGKEITILKEILSQSTPLIPEIEKGIRQGLSICLNKKDWAYGISGSVKQDIQNYITNLKLDI